jgi:hypothetical protein
VIITNSIKETIYSHDNGRISNFLKRFLNMSFIFTVQSSGRVSWNMEHGRDEKYIK